MYWIHNTKFSVWITYYRQPFFFFRTHYIIPFNLNSIFTFLSVHALRLKPCLGAHDRSASRVINTRVMMMPPPAHATRSVTCKWGGGKGFTTTHPMVFSTPLLAPVYAIPVRPSPGSCVRYFEVLFLSFGETASRFVTVASYLLLPA